MSAPRPVVILGTGPGAVEILDLIADLADRGSPTLRCIGFLDDDPARQGQRIAGLPVLGPLASARDHRDAAFVNGIGSVANHARRDRIVAATGLDAERFVSVVHPAASVSRRASVGPGVVLYPHVAVRGGARLEAGVLVLANSVVDHDAAVGAHTCLASGVGLAGGVRIGRCCYLGMHASVAGGVAVGDHSLIGMGAVVRHDVEPGSVMVGNPARLLRRLAPP